MIQNLILQNLNNPPGPATIVFKQTVTSNQMVYKNYDSYMEAQADLVIILPISHWHDDAGVRTEGVFSLSIIPT